MPPLKQTVNDALKRATGYQLQKAGTANASVPVRRRRGPGAGAGDRLLEHPAFILSTVRSGSTLLRVILDSHSAIHSPPEIHLRSLEATVADKYAERSMKELGLEGEALQFLLWDRVLHRELSRAGKTQLVNKTPNDVFIADRIMRCWPDARFIYLLRHPVSTARSRQETRPQDSEERNTEMVLRYANALEAARSTYPGETVRYEELTADPEATIRRVCAFLGIAFAPAMLDYGSHDHGRFRPGLGDWKDKIKSGEIQPPEPLPSEEEIPSALRDISVAWGYAQA
jgi:hypothetical protein